MIIVTADGTALSSSVQVLGMLISLRFGQLENAPVAMLLHPSGTTTFSAEIPAKASLSIIVSAEGRVRISAVYT